MPQSGGTGGQPRISIDSDRLLLVEGRDEVNLFNALISRCVGDAPYIQIIQAGGISQFPSRLKAIQTAAKTRPDLQSIGVIRDADENPAGAFQSVCAHLSTVGFDAPRAHGAFTGGTPSVGVFIVPTDTQQGAIETLCRRSVEDSAAGRCVEQYLQCLEEHDAIRSANRDKSFAHAYLASTQDPVARVGEGALRRVWNFDAPAFEDIVRFVCDLTTQAGEATR